MDGYGITLSKQKLLHGHGVDWRKICFSQGMYNSSLSQSAAKHASSISKKEKMPKNLLIGAIEKETGLGEWKRKGKYLCHHNNLHELCSHPRKKTAAAIKSFLKKSPHLGLARDETAKGRGMTPMHLLCLATFNKKIVQEEKIFTEWHLNCFRTYLEALKSSAAKLMNTPSHDGRTPLFILFQSSVLTIDHVVLAMQFAKDAFLSPSIFYKTPIFPLVRSQKLTLSIIKVYVSIMVENYNLNAKKSEGNNQIENSDDGTYNVILRPDRTNRKRTPLHELCLSKSIGTDVLLYVLNHANVPHRHQAVKSFFYKCDAHGSTAFELMCANEHAVSNEFLNTLLNRLAPLVSYKIQRHDLNALCKNHRLSSEMLETVLSSCKPVADSNSVEENLYIRNISERRDQVLDTLLHVLAGLRTVTAEHFKTFFKHAGKKSLNSLDANGDSPFHIYCGNESSIDCDCLIELLNNVDYSTFSTTDKYSENIVHLLCRNSCVNAKIINTVGAHARSKQLLLEKNRNEHTPLMLLCMNGNVSVAALSAYVRFCPEAMKQRESGRSPLSILCQNSKVNAAMISAMLRNKMSADDEKQNGGDKNGHTAIGHLLRYNSESAFKTIKQCVNVFMARLGNKYCRQFVDVSTGVFLFHRDTPLTDICKKIPIDTTALSSISESNAEYFVSIQKNNRTTLHDLCRNKSLTDESFRIYCESATDAVMSVLIHQKDNYLENPLFILVRNTQCSADMLRYIFKLDNGAGKASALQKNDNGESPLHILCKSKHVTAQKLKAFVESGPTNCIYMKANKSLKTCIHFLCENNYCNTEECLRSVLMKKDLRQKGILAWTDERTRTPLSFLVRRQRPPSAKEISLYLNFGKDLNAMSALTMKDSSECTPLILLVRRVQDEQVARGVLNACLELWAVSEGNGDKKTRGKCWTDLRDQIEAHSRRSDDPSSTRTKSINDARVKDQGNTPLLYILGKSDESSNEALANVLDLSSQSYATCQDELGNSTLHHAIQASKLNGKNKLDSISVKSVVKKIANQSPYLLTHRNHLGRTPAEEAQHLGYKDSDEIVSMLKMKKCSEGTGAALPIKEQDANLSYEEQSALIKLLRNRISQLES